MESNAALLDQFGRTHDYLRISLTEKCNLRCTYCMPEEGLPLRPMNQFLTDDEIFEVAEHFVKKGVRKIRLTGGEPLVRKGVGALMRRLSTLDIELHMTTNGILLDRFWEDLKAANISSLNISLDSLQEKRFNAISRRSHFQAIMGNITSAIKRGFKVKINVVLMNGFNDDEVVDFIKWTEHQSISVRFIEFMPFDGNNWDRSKTVSLETVLNKAETEFGERILKLERYENDTSKNFKIDGFSGDFGVISTVTQPFCSGCNRLRLTADGKLKNCLFSRGEVDLKFSLRGDLPLDLLITEALQTKAKALGGITTFDSERLADYENRSMIAIGG